MRRAVLSLALACLGGCSRSGTGVELTIDAGGLTLDQLIVVAAYDNRSLSRTVAAPAGAALDLLAELPDESTRVRFDVTGLAGGLSIAHGASMVIDVTPHHIGNASIVLAASGGGADLGPVDGADLADLAGGGALWSHQHGTLPPGAGSLNGVWGSSGGDVYAVTSATGGVNLYRSIDHGAHWTGQLAGVSAVDLNGVGGTTASDVYLVGNGGLILHGSGTSWSAQSAPVTATTRLNGVYAVAPGDVYIAGSGNVVLHSPAGGGWIDQTAVGTTELRAVWGVPGRIWVVGSGGTILKSTGNATWSPDTSGTSAELRAIWGSSATDVWVVGDGVVLHFDGNSWAPAADGVPPGLSLRGLGGHVGGPLFAVGAGFTILRRDPTLWVAEPTGLPIDDPSADRLNAVFVPSAVEAFVGGDGATILHRP